jgi:hypothetical protein
MMSCQVSEKPNKGTTTQQAMNVAGLPVACATVPAIRVNERFNAMPELLLETARCPSLSAKTCMRE